MAKTENTPVIHGNSRYSGGYNNERGQVSKETIEHMQCGWDDREVIQAAEAMADRDTVKEAELSLHF